MIIVNGLPAAIVLLRRSEFLAQLLRSLARPVRIPQQLAAEEDEIGPAIANNLFCQGRFGNQPDGAGRDAG